MTNLRADIVRSIFRVAPVPGRYLSTALSAARVDLQSINGPLLCDDRWHEFEIGIDDLSDVIQRHIFFQGYFEFWETRLLRRELKPGDVFLDVGANIGWHSLVAANRVGQCGRVIALEPVPSTYSALVRNSELNGYGSLEPHNLGLSNKNGVLSIFAPEEANCGANSLYPGAGAPAPVCDITVEVGDQFLQRIGCTYVHLCKIDVEGAEIDVLEGLVNSLHSGMIGKIMIEVNPTSLERAGRSPAELLSKLDACGYKMRDIRTGRPFSAEAGVHHMVNLICSR